MRKNILSIFLFLLSCCPIFGSDKIGLDESKTDIWYSEDRAQSVMINIGSAANTEYSVRAILAGTMDSFMHETMLFKPKKIRFGEALGMPAFIAEGEVFGIPSYQRCEVLVLFEKERTVFIHRFSKEKTELPSLDGKVKVSGSPNEHTKEAFAYLEARLNENFYSKFGEVIDKLRKLKDQVQDKQPQQSNK